MPAINPVGGVGPIAEGEIYPHFTQYYLATGLAYVGTWDYAAVDATATEPAATMGSDDEAMAAAGEGGGVPNVEEAETMADEVPIDDPSAATNAMDTDEAMETDVLSRMLRVSYRFTG